ncbi:hypothetical protein [Paenibacillus agilis]|uniref:Lipoprotein n=1 Tax=Paenibacillus agilis TaxID=3020863 RepID=A0A559IL04_9BACL|nr:hypothetical protein [Paenibacillus agilis]TVX88163.1 hypothetical protein FPZ44_19855 [Paenibacillus agilis]
MDKFKVIIIGLCLLLLSGCGVLDYFVNEHRDNDTNILVLSKDYRLFRANEEIHYVKGKGDSDPVVIDSDVLEIAWDDAHIFYKRRDVKSNVEEYGVFSVETKNHITFQDANSLKQHLDDNGIKEKVLENVEELLKKKNGL